MYDNKPASVLILTCRINNLRLKGRNRFKQEESRRDVWDRNGKFYKLILWCPNTMKLEKKYFKLQGPYIEQKEHMTGTLTDFWRKKEKD